MKKLMFLFLIFTTLALSQNFTIRSLGGKTSSDVTGADILLISNSAGALKKLSYTNLMANLDDETWTWTGANTFSGTVTFSGNVLMPNSSYLRLGTFSTAAVGGSIFWINTTRDYIAYHYENASGSIDTLASWNKLLYQNNTTYGDWTFNGAATFGGNITISGSSSLMLGSDHSTSVAGSLFRLTGGDRVNLLMTYNASGGRDTMVTFYELLLKDRTAYGAWIFNGDVTFADILGATFSGAITQQDVLHKGYETIAVTTTTLVLSGNSNHYEVSLSAGAKTITSFSVTDIARGDMIFISNTTSTAMTLNDAAPFNLTAAFVMDEDDNIMLYYDGTTYNEVSRSDN